jgi:hypothetical protein
MTHTRYIWDKHLESMIEIGDGTNSPMPEKRVGASNLMRDYENFEHRGMVDHKQGAGHALHITKGRRQLRDEERARGVVQVGNEKAGWSPPPKMPDAGPMVREALARTGFYDGAKTLRALRRQQFRD